LNGQDPVTRAIGLEVSIVLELETLLPFKLLREFFRCKRSDSLAFVFFNVGLSPPRKEKFGRG